MKKSYLTITDQFCGAGGSSQGARRLSRKMGGGLEIKLAMNHWDLAIETHNTNFPETDHDCADVSASDPRRYQSTDILLTSPECTNHSLAKGVKRKSQVTKTLFGDITIDPSAVRSRATMWDVPRFAEIHSYNLIIVENVVDARKWIMWDAWLHAMHNLGYQHKCVYMNSQHALPTPQSRDRMYVVFWKKGNKSPNLDFRPKAYCHHCSLEVESIQSWRDSRKKFGKYKQQYDYRCPRCGSIVEPYYYASFNVIDWSIPAEKIGERKRALSPNTMKRIEHGLDRYGNQQLVLYTDQASRLDRHRMLDGPMFTQTTRQVAALINPPMIVYCNNSSNYKNHIREISNTMQTQTTHHGAGLLNPGFLVRNYGGNFDPKYSPLGFENSVGTITTKDSHGLLLTPSKSINIPFMVKNFGASKSKPITNPIGCQMTINKYGIVSHEAVSAFLAYYYGNSTPSGMAEAINTVTTVDRAGLVITPRGNIDINECTYRMLKPHEVQAAMAFEEDYIVLGSGKDKVKQLGNAVTPPAMEWLLERGIETFN